VEVGESLKENVTHTHTYTDRQTDRALLILPQKHRDTLCVLVKKRKRGGYLLYNLSKEVSSIVKRSGCTAPLPFIPLLEARSLCLIEDRATSLPATLHWTNTWELPPANESRRDRKKNGTRQNRLLKKRPVKTCS